MGQVEHRGILYPLFKRTVIAVIVLLCAFFTLHLFRITFLPDSEPEIEWPDATGLAVVDAQVIATQPTTRPVAAVKSVTPTPRSWSRDGLIQSFALAAEIGPLICLPDPVDWWYAQGKSDKESKPHRDSRWQTVLIRQHGLKVFVQIDPYKTRRGKIPGLPKTVKKASFADPVLRRAFIADAVQRVRLYNARYVCLAMEINAYYEENAEDFDHFVSLFKEARREVKKIKPDAIVFVSFQYEQLLGRFGGQGHLPKHPPRWELFDKFEPDQDAVGISTYPLATFSPPRYADPSKVPADYYSPIARHTNKPIIFAEVGWPSDPAFGGSPEKQAAFIRRLDILLGDLNVLMVNWNFLYDVKGFGPVFDSMGMFDSRGRAKPSLGAWKELWTSNP